MGYNCSPERLRLDLEELFHYTVDEGKELGTVTTCEKTMKQEGISVEYQLTASRQTVLHSEPVGAGPRPGVDPCTERMPGHCTGTHAPKQADRQTQLKNITLKGQKRKEIHDSIPMGCVLRAC